MEIHVISNKFLYSFQLSNKSRTSKTSGDYLASKQPKMSKKLTRLLYPSCHDRTIRVRSATAINLVRQARIVFERLTNEEIEKWTGRKSTAHNNEIIANEPRNRSLIDLSGEESSSHTSAMRTQKPLSAKKAAAVSALIKPAPESPFSKLYDTMMNNVIDLDSDSDIDAPAAAKPAPKCEGDGRLDGGNWHKTSTAEDKHNRTECSTHV